jgi:hypothetical protein
MLGVERPLAGAVGPRRRRRRRLARPAAEVRHGHGRREADPAAAGAQRGAEVDVLEVHEIALVDEADRLGGVAPDQQARAGDPVRPGRRARAAIDLRERLAVAARRGREEALLPPLGEGPDHCAGRQLGAAVAVHQPRADRDRRRILAQRGDQAVDRARRHDRVAVEQQDQLARRGADADVVGAREAGVLAEREEPHAGPAVHDLEAAVGRGVVDHHDLVRRPRRGVGQAVEAPGQIRGRVVADDDDRERRHVAASRSACSVRRAVVVQL